MAADLVDLLVEPKGSAIIGIVVAVTAFVCVFLLPPIALRRMDRLEAAIARRRLRSADRPSTSE